MLDNAWKKLLRSDAGSLTIMVGLMASLLAGAIGASVEYVALSARQSRLQTAADSAALAATKELSLANSDDARITALAANIARTALASGGTSTNTSSLTVGSQVLDQRRAVQVSVSEMVDSWFGRILSYPSFQISARAIAHFYGATKLCVLSLDPASQNAVLLDKTAKVTATECSVYANSTSPQAILSKDSAVLRAARVCTAGGYSAGAGNISATVVTDCPQYKDPLAGRAAPANSTACDYTGLIVSATRILSPGVYCNGLTIDNGANVTLPAGTYVISGGPLVVTGGATLQGDNVGFYLAGSAATLDFRPDSNISLSAPKTGAMSGMLFFEDRAAPLLRMHSISSKNARRLLGTFYLSRGLLKVDSNNPVADQSAYTVIVSRQLQVTNGPNLVMNAMYTSSDIPVPEGVGPNGLSVALTQ